MSTIKDILLPDLGEGIETAVISEVSVSPGDIIKPDDTIIVLESDKATMEIPADVSGAVMEILVESGTEVKSGDQLIKVELSKSKRDRNTPQLYIPRSQIVALSCLGGRMETKLKKYFIPWGGRTKFIDSYRYAL